MMNRRLSLAAILFLLAPIFAGCESRHAIDSTPTETWKSEYFPVSVVITDGWRKTHVNSPGDTYDRPEGAIIAFVRKAGLHTYILRIEPGVSFDVLPRDDYVKAVESQYQNQPGYEFVSRDDIQMHGRSFDRLLYRIEGDGKISMMHICIFRDDDHLVTIQMTTPLDAANPNQIPEAIKSFDDGVTLNFTS